MNGRDDNGNTALHWAAYKGFVEVAQLLMAYGANAGRTNARKQTPVQVAEIRKHPDVAEAIRPITHVVSASEQL